MKKIDKSLSGLVTVCRRTLILAATVMLTTAAYASNIFQWKNIQVQAKNETLQNVLKQIEREANCKIVYSNSLVAKHSNVTLDMKNARVQDVLNKVLGETDLTYSIENEVITIFQQAKPQPKTQLQTKEIKGVVTEKNSKKPIAGVTLIIADSNNGAITDEKGAFVIKAKTGDKIEVSFVGMVSQVITIDAATQTLNIIMEPDAMAVDDVVVTGYFERKKDTFTGSAKTISGDQLRNVSKTNILNALSILDPSLSVKQNNQQGSNPNVLPDIIIRGTSSLNTTGAVGVNTPLIVIDGVESDLRALYDIDIFDIETVVTLKDASATALYGEQAANGVILVNRKKSSQKEVRVSYNFTGKVDFADLSGYDMMNAREKLDFERLSGVYDDKTGKLYETYAKKLAYVNSGIDTDWISKPLRTSFSHTHNLNVSGEGSGLSYQVTARYGNNNGVMKGDKRENIGFGTFFSYNLNNKIIATLRADYSQNSTLGSNYGEFRNFVDANPYDAPFDDEREYVKLLSSDLVNPLYESSLASFSKTKDKIFNASLNVRWNILQNLYVVGFGSIEGGNNRKDQYISPLSSTFADEKDENKRGSYELGAGESTDYLLKLTATYTKNIDNRGSMFTLNAGGELRSEKLLPYGFTTVGFFNDFLSDPAFGAGYKDGDKATGESSESATVAFISAANFTFLNRYFIDGSFRLSGSSKFGEDQRTAPFWSVGAGWNIHRENWFGNNDTVNTLRLRGSYGHTGSIMFTSYQAITTYRYASNLIGKYGIGANPITMGNNDLKWQTTKSLNVGLTSTFLKERLDVNLDWYNTRTVDMIVPISMPPSSGITSVNSNVGEQKNNGFELDVSGSIISNKDWTWRVGVNAAHNKNKLVKIGNSLSALNNVNALKTENSPLAMFVEGESATMLYAVKSGGIDPATGREIYINKNGVPTYTYDGLDKIALGDTEPEFRGAVSSFLTYKGFSLNISLQYSMGGYIYNTTRASRIEQINPKYNADKRAYTQRWKKPGDVVNYLTIKPNKDGTINNYHSSRFVEKENFLNISYISLGYEFESVKLKKIGFKRLNFSVAMNDVANFSTVKQERGTLYPFSRGFSFTISPTF